jgi:hypothetical protein
MRICRCADMQMCGYEDRVMWGWGDADINKKGRKNPAFCYSTSSMAD